MTNTAIANVYSSGFVTRYHTHPYYSRQMQTLADHQGRCVQLLLLMHPEPSVALLRAAAFHDVGEYLVGDPPPGLNHIAPEVAKLVKRAEAIALQTVLGFDIMSDLSDTDRDWLKLVDLLERALFMAHGAASNEMATHVVQTEFATNIKAVSDRLGITDRISRLLDIAEG